MLKPDARATLFAYLSGVLTTTVVGGLLFLGVGYRFGLRRTAVKLREVLLPAWNHHHGRSDRLIPAALLPELIRHRAVVDNADNPTNQSEHDSILVRPDPVLTYVLRPSVTIDAFFLGTNSFNWDPPVLFLPAGVEMSPSLRQYIREQSRLHYRISTDSQGFRRTLPEVSAAETILVVGDSVAFGIGVDDDKTVASHLQQRVGRRFRVINAAVGGYEAPQEVETASLHSREVLHRGGLVYVVCRNDLEGPEPAQVQVERIVERLTSLAPRFNNRVIVVYHDFMENCLADIFLGGMLEPSNDFRRSWSVECRRRGFRYIDWPDLVHRFKTDQQSIFAPFALYADHCHFSPLGNKLLADEIYRVSYADALP